MLSKPTIFVLGAGASSDFGLPLGDRLATILRDSLSFEADEGDVTKGDRRLVDAYRNGGQRPHPFMVAAQQIASALPNFKSIDDCLHTHSDNKLGVLAGKMAIAAAIADAEGKSSVRKLLDPDRRVSEPALAAIRAGWAGTLVRILVTGLAGQDYRDVFNHLTIISFNYDRCIEMVLHKLIQSALNISDEEAGRAMEGLKVYHPYGSLGPPKYGSQPGTLFAPPHPKLVEMAQRLFVYTEARDIPDDLQLMKEAVHQHDRLVFLGFGFHRQNIEILAKPEEIPKQGKEMMGTVMGEPPQAIDVYKTRLSQRLGVAGPWRLEQTDCSSFMSANSSVLSG